jgi:hypothetical protein
VLLCRTCLDNLLWCDYIDSTQNFELIESLLAYDVPLASVPHRGDLSLLARIKLEDYHLSISNCDEALETILCKSETGLQHLLDNGYEPYANDISSYFYRVATSIGWTRGCEILFSHRLFRLPLGDAGDLPLLELAVDSGNLQTLEFWLDVRKGAKEHELDGIGSLEEAAAAVGPVTHAIDKATWFSTIIDALVRSRLQLEEMVATHGIQVPCHGNSHGRLDVHARCAIGRLLAAGVDVPANLWPFYTSAYFVLWFPSQGVVDLLDTLFEAGFQDILPSNFTCGGQKSLSPFQYCVTLAEAPTIHTIQYFHWFLSKGADRLECWPCSTVTAIHCLGWKLGTGFQHYSLRFDSIFHASVGQQIIPLLDGKDSDCCVCACSTSGCLFLNCLWKGITDYQYPQYNPSTPNRTVISCIEAATEKQNNRWLINAYIRLYTFDVLELRHTCCDIRRVQHGRYEDIDLSISPTPRYPPTILQRIQKEDAFLVSLLEELVPAFDADYDTFGGDLEAFVKNYLDPQLKEKLKVIKKQDTEQYGQGRRELGVIMELEADEENTEEDVNNDKLEGEDKTSSDDES